MSKVISSAPPRHKNRDAMSVEELNDHFRRSLTGEMSNIMIKHGVTTARVADHLGITHNAMKRLLDRKRPLTVDHILLFSQLCCKAVQISFVDMPQPSMPPILTEPIPQERIKDLES